MIEQQARVIAQADGQLQVLIGGQSGCPACDAGRGCGAGLFGRLLRRRPLELSLPSREPYAVGQAVTVGLREPLFLRLIALLYLVPLLAGLAGAAAGLVIADRFEWPAGATDLTILCGALLAATGALKIRDRTLRPEIGPSDIQLVGRAPNSGECDLPR